MAMRRLICAIFFLLLGQATLAKEYGQKVSPVRKQLLLRAERGELNLLLGPTIPSYYTRHMLFCFGGSYFITDWVGVGADIIGSIPMATNLTSQLQNELSLESNSKVSLPRSGFDFITAAKVTFVPLSGKLVLMNRYLGYVDFFLSVGGGMAHVKGYNGLSSRVSYAITVGGGLRFYPVKFLSVNIEVMDYMVSMAMPENSQVKDTDNPVYKLSVGKTVVPYYNRIVQNPAILFGVSLYLPFEPKRGE
jgi:hypothetical protein